MSERNLPASDATYRPLKSWVASRGDARLRLHGPMRDRIVEAIVEEWPQDCPSEKLEEVLRARLKVRLQKRYGSVVAMFLLGILINAIIKLVIEWWFKRQSHRDLMAGWVAQAAKDRA